MRAQRTDDNPATEEDGDDVCYGREEDDLGDWTDPGNEGEQAAAGGRGGGARCNPEC